MRSRIVVTLGTLCVASTATAQEWDWEITPYLWGSGIEGDVALGSVARGVDLEFGDIVDVLAGAALVHVEGGNAGYGIFGDLVWMSLEPEDEIATVGGTAEAEFDTTIVELGYVRKLPRVGVELGVRYWDLEVELDPALLAAVARSDSWVDGFIGFRRSQDIGEKWQSTMSFNVGAGGSDLTWSFNLLYGRELESGNRFVTGLKVIDIDYEETTVNGLLFRQDLTFAGATVGFLFD
jgi:hypothetical protein